MSSLNSNQLNNSANNFLGVNNKKSFNISLKNKKVTLLLLIIGVILFVLLIVVSVKLHTTYKANKINNIQEVELIKYMYDCKGKEEIIGNGTLPTSAIGNEYCLTFWIYINHLEYRYYDDKYILIKGDLLKEENGKYPVSNPAIYIPKNSNRLKLHFETEGGNYDEDLGCFELTPAISNIVNTEDTKTPEECLQYGKDEGASYYAMSHPSLGPAASGYKSRCHTLTDNEKDLILKTNEVSVNTENCSLNSKDPERTETHLGSDTHTYISNIGDDTEEQNCEINNFPLQKWNCVSINVHDNICDIFLDGYLHKTCAFKGIIKPNNYPMIISPNDGLDAYLTSMTYVNKTQSPQDIYKKFKKGPRILLSSMDRIKSMF